MKINNKQNEVEANNQNTAMKINRSKGPIMHNSQWYPSSPFFLAGRITGIIFRKPYTYHIINTYSIHCRWPCEKKTLFSVLYTVHISVFKHHYHFFLQSTAHYWLCRTLLILIVHRFCRRKFSLIWISFNRKFQNASSIHTRCVHRPARLRYTSE